MEVSQDHITEDHPLIMDHHNITTLELHLNILEVHLDIDTGSPLVSLHHSRVTIRGIILQAMDSLIGRIMALHGPIKIMNITPRMHHLCLKQTLLTRGLSSKMASSQTKSKHRYWQFCMLEFLYKTLAGNYNTLIRNLWHKISLSTNIKQRWSWSWLQCVSQCLSHWLGNHI